jgi:hypothetical protein
MFIQERWAILHPSCILGDRKISVGVASASNRESACEVMETPDWALAKPDHATPAQSRYDTYEQELRRFCARFHNKERKSSPMAQDQILFGGTVHHVLCCSASRLDEAELNSVIDTGDVIS